MASNTERSRLARSALIRAGRELFGLEGYAATSTPAVARRAGVSRGALYHHFKDKEALFRAVIEDEFSRVESEIERISDQHEDPLDALIEGGNRFIEVMSDTIPRQLLLIDGPSVLGNEALREIDVRTTTGSLNAGIRAAQSAGRLPMTDPDALTSVMSGAYDRAVIDGFLRDAKGRMQMRTAIADLWRALAKTA